MRPQVGPVFQVLRLPHSCDPTFEVFVFDRDLHDGAAADLIGIGKRAIDFAIKTFETMPPKHNGKAIPASRMIAVVQGWDVTDDEITAQRRAAEKAGAAGYVVVYDEIEQGWSPKIVRWK